MIHKYYKALLTDCLGRDFTRQNLLKEINHKTQIVGFWPEDLRYFTWEILVKASFWEQELSSVI